MEQQAIQSADLDSVTSYKVIREMGFFHKTLTRDVLLPVKTDSVAVIEFQENTNIFVRIYFQNNKGTDSININVPLVLNRDSSKLIQKENNLN
ncbi:MAG: hypothetical protein IPP71_14645 [Bacteroidetes bacterium]|nr:hypothetical protein [Bacteroidota bacterium]